MERIEATRERIVMLTDAVVAIAMTLLVLPLIEAAPEVDPDDVLGFLADNWGLFLSFAISFLVIYVFWVEHRQLFAAMSRATSVIRVLNMLWLLVVAFIAFPTALIGREATTSTVPFYLATVLVLCALTAAMTSLAKFSDPEMAAWERHHALRLWIVAGVVLVCALIGLWNPDLGLYGMLLILVLRLADRRRAVDDGSA